MPSIHSTPPPQDNGVINLCTHSDNQAQKSQLNQGQGSGSAPVVLTAEARDLMLVRQFKTCL